MFLPGFIHGNARNKSISPVFLPVDDFVIPAFKIPAFPSPSMELIGVEQGMKTIQQIMHNEWAFYVPNTRTSKANKNHDHCSPHPRAPLYLPRYRNVKFPKLFFPAGNKSVQDAFKYIENS
jgi:hypothetical protein